MKPMVKKPQALFLGGVALGVVARNLMIFGSIFCILHVMLQMFQSLGNLK